MKLLSVDSETTGLDFAHGLVKPFFVTLCDDTGRITYYEWDVDPLTRIPHTPPEDLTEIVSLIDSADELVLQNSKFDRWAFWSVLPDWEWPWHKTQDTLIAAHLLHTKSRHDLTALGVMYLGRDISPLEDALEHCVKSARRYCRSHHKDWLIAKEGLSQLPSVKKSQSKGEKDKSWKSDMWLPRALAKHENRPADDPYWTVLADYSNKDSETTVALWPVMKEELERKDLWELYVQRIKLPSILYTMERRGMTTLSSNMAVMADDYENESYLCGEECRKIAATFNYPLELPKSGNNGSLTRFVFGSDDTGSPLLNLPVVGYTDSGAPSLDKDAMNVYLRTLEGSQLEFIKNLSVKRKLDTGTTYMNTYRRFMIPLEESDGTSPNDSRTCLDGGVGVHHQVQVEEGQRGGGNRVQTAVRCNSANRSHYQNREREEKEKGYARLHPTVNATGSSTLRYTCNNPNCFDGETEILTVNGWVRADQLADGVRIAQYDSDTEAINFVVPEVLRQHYVGDMYRITTEEQIDLLVTPNHRILLQNRKTGKKFDVEAKDLKDDFKYPNAGVYVGGPCSLTDAQVVWVCAVQADGHYCKTNGEQYGIRLMFSKKRKIERLETCLKELGINYSKKITGKLTSFYVGKNEPYTQFVKELMPNKCFGSWLLGYCRKTLDKVSTEIFEWDGDSTRRASWASMTKDNADWVQILTCLSGSRAFLTSRQPFKDKVTKDFHTVNVSQGRSYSMTTNHVKEIVSWDGLIYCVSVPTTYLVIRRNGRVSITGNTQQISKQDRINLRRGFGPEPGREWYSLDAANIEMRIPAYEVNEEELVKVFERPNEPPYYGSYHLVVFDALYPELFAKLGKHVKAPESEGGYEATLYQWVKNGNFSLLYGSQEGNSDITYHMEGAYRKIWKRFPRIAELNWRMIRFADKHGYVETIPDKSIGAKRGYPIVCARGDYGKISPTIPLNYHIQPTAGWWITMAEIRCEEKLVQWRKEGFDAFITAQVHDEIVFDFPASRRYIRVKTRDGYKEVPENYMRVQRMRKLMEEGGVGINVPTPVAVEFHPDNWAVGIVL